MRQKTWFYSWFITLVIGVLVACSENKPQNPVAESLGDVTPIDRQAWVSRHNPRLQELNAWSPFTLGNGQFAFTADVTGLQSFYRHYYDQGMPLETKARWAWHSRENPKAYTLKDASEDFDAYGRIVAFPSKMDSKAGQWLRKNPHDLPLFRAGFSLQESALLTSQISEINQSLDLWQGQLNSSFSLKNSRVEVTTLVDGEFDTLAAQVQSPLLQQGLAVDIEFPRGYLLNKKNTPQLDWQNDNEHRSILLESTENYALIQRVIDNAEHYVALQWQGSAELNQVDPHLFRLQPKQTNIDLAISVLQEKPLSIPSTLFTAVQDRAATALQTFWHSGAALDFSGSSYMQADELERRIVLSRYLMYVQSRAAIPTQETGLTSSSWYGKHHSEMTYWHVAHWILWGNPEFAERTLDWYLNHLSSAKALAASRGLRGARWAKMVGPDNRESPGGNPLIIWNQPQLIHMAELLYQTTQDIGIIHKYFELVEETAWGLSSMLVYDPVNDQYDLEPPIWIAQEIYDPKISHNPTFELAYWRTGLEIAHRWHERVQMDQHPEWQEQLDKLAPLAQKDNKYVAIESIPDTFDNIDSRKDHPSMLAAYGMLKDPRVDTEVMSNTLMAVKNHWDWKKKIWGWDYPMIAMTAARLNQPQTAVDFLLADLTHNQYLPNGHVPQAGAGLPVYLPANGALLSAVAMMTGGWDGSLDRRFPGFPVDGQWQIKAEGFVPYRF